MAKKVRLAILRARHVPTASISEAACIEMLMTSTTRRSVLNYWTDNTDGYLDFVGSEMFPWVNISLTAADVNSFNVIHRRTQAQRAYSAAKAAFNDNNELVGFDGFVVIILPGELKIPNPMAGQPNQPATIAIVLDGGATNVLGKFAAVIPVGADHTFMCHEVGHVLGFNHSYGIGKVYGDPYDIMSSASFGAFMQSSKPTFAGPSPAGWPVQPTTGMGCAPARAQVHKWNPAALPASAVTHLPVPSGGGKHSLRLYTASKHVGSPRLIAIHPSNEDAEGRGRCYLEYRDQAGWDAGLDTAGTDLARRAVVAHTLADTNEGVRCWYRGRVLVPIEQDSDLAVAGTPLVVQVTDANVDDGYVDLEISTSTARGVDIRSWGRDDIIASIDEHQMGTPCGDTITHATWITQTTWTYRPTTFGYGGEGAFGVKPPRFFWTVGTVPITAHSNPISVPTATGTFTIECILDIDTDELTLISRGGEKYSVEVQCDATESDGIGNRTFTKVNFEPLGYFTGFRASDLAKLDKCMGKYARSAGLSHRDFLIPPGPDPYREKWKDRINLAAVDEVARRLADDHPAQSLGLSVAAAMRYGKMRKE